MASRNECRICIHNKPVYGVSCASSKQSTWCCYVVINIKIKRTYRSIAMLYIAFNCMISILHFTSYIIYYQMGPRYQSRAACTQSKANRKCIYIYKCLFFLVLLIRGKTKRYYFHKIQKIKCHNISYRFDIH